MHISSLQNILMHSPTQGIKTQKWAWCRRIKWGNLRKLKKKKKNIKYDRNSI